MYVLFEKTSLGVSRHRLKGIKTIFEMCVILSTLMLSGKKFGGQNGLKKKEIFTEFSTQSMIFFIQKLSFSKGTGSMKSI